MFLLPPILASTAFVCMNRAVSPLGVTKTSEACLVDTSKSNGLITKIAESREALVKTTGNDVLTTMSAL